MSRTVRRRRRFAFPTDGAPVPSDPDSTSRHSPPVVAALARETLYLSLGLSVLGLQRFQAERPELERRLEAYGLPQAAAATRTAGRLIDAQVARLLG